MLFFDKEKDFVGVCRRSMNALLFCICYESDLFSRVIL